MQLPLVHFFETSFGRIYDKHFIIVRVDGDGLAGYGECVADQDPYYSAETNATAWHIIEEFIAPRVVGVTFAHPRDVFAALKPIRGHNMAKAAVEMAAWDLYARLQGVPLSRVLGGTRERIASGVSIGIQDSLPELAAAVKRELAAGYRRIKIKIKPGWDLDAVETAHACVGDVPLMVDANAAYTLADMEHLAKLDRFDLMMIEQPLDYDDIANHAVLQRAVEDADLPRRIDQDGPGRRERDRRRGLPHHQHQAGPRRRLHRIDPAARPVRGARHSGLARRDARVRHRSRRQHPPVHAAEFHAARRHRREQALLQP